MYPVLQFIAPSLKLRLGEVTDAYKELSLAAVTQDDDPQGTAWATPFKRVPGLPLLSTASDAVVGSLHPDNVEMLPEPGSEMDCLVLSRCFTPTVASPLFNAENPETHSGSDRKRWDLFWVLYVVMIEGIAERRGIGQILASALEVTTPPPELKWILLG